MKSKSTYDVSKVNLKPHTLALKSVNSTEVVGKRSENKEEGGEEEKYLIATSEQTIAAFHR